MRRANGEVHASLWEQGTMTDLGTLGGIQSNAIAINARGQVLGNSLTADGEFRPFVWEGATMIALPPLASGFDGAGATATAINSAGQVVGESVVSPNGERHAVLWTR